MIRTSAMLLATLGILAFGFGVLRWGPPAALAAAPKPVTVKIKSNNGKVSFEVSGSDVPAVIRAFKQVQGALASMEGKERIEGTPPARELPSGKERIRDRK
ncbi:MAG: hypothetical protein HYY20_10495 [Candidatus Tectomicrobia bacterium]|uniref:Uncharacterized protein n=1 Tax=Tectimicrobiota bacterium TaxID=2528274 RepID=A0A932G1I6_UNCTE|nr:hypothetical protein [Candidatus Tectomicrobia bacterium]